MKYFNNTKIIDNEILKEFIIEPDKFVYSFRIKEKHKVRDMLTYNKGLMYGEKLKQTHYNVAELFEENFCERNQYSFAYHKNVRCKDALESHLKSTYFIKLDIHHFFESITEDVFFKIYQDRFNKKWTEILKGCFYKKNLCIGFVTSPVISDFFMSKFDNTIASYLEKNPKLHYSRYCDDILISSEEEDDKNLQELFELIKENLSNLELNINDKKTRFIKLDYNTHNSISFLGLNISKQDEINNKVTISKNYILFLLKLIEKNNKYESRCKGLLDEINSRVAYLAYNSPVSFKKFQTKHIRKFGLSYNFVPKKPLNRYYGSKTDNIYDWDEYVKDFVINIHSKVVDEKTKEVILGDSIQLVKYIGTDEEVIIPPFVDSIGPNAFNNAYWIKKVVLNNKIRSIGDSAFSGCTNLEQIELPNSLNYIGYRTFEDCQNLKTITIPKKVKRINDNVFFNSGLKNIIFNEGLKSISTRAFANTKIEILQLPNTLEELGLDSFSDCIYLKTINLSEKLLSIPHKCFARCKSLKTINFQESILSIETMAFYNCSNLEELYIPKNIINIDSTAFDLCNNLTHINVDRENKVLDSRNNCNAIIETHKNKIIITTKNTKIEDGIEIIGASSFANSLVTEIKLPQSLRVIEANAFSNCFLLKELELSENIEEIGDSAFKNCISLTSVKLPNKLKNISKLLFAGCNKIKEISLPNQLENIGDKAFYNLNLLKSISLPKILKSIGYKAFGNCYLIENLYIPENVNEIKPYAFAGCTKSLKTIQVAEFNTKYDSRNNCNAIIETKKNKLLLGCQNTTIEYGIKKIDDFAFAYCKDLKEINLPKTVTTIGNKAFIDCNQLQSINLNNVNRIEDYVFENCTSLLSLNLPNSLVSIGSNSFSNCTSLKDLTLSDSTIKIYDEIFMGCNSIENIFIPKTFRDINIAFLFRQPLKSIKVDEKNPIYDSRNNCNAIIRKSDNTLILGCENTIIPDDIKIIGSNAFDGSNVAKIKIPKNIKRIKSYAFANCDKLEEIIIPQSVQYIESGAFSNCKNLKKITLPSNLEIIQDNMFYNCTSLAEIELPTGIKRIENSAFLNTKLTTVTLPIYLETIDEFVFEHCEELENIYFNKSCKTIRRNAFSGCTSLKTIELPKSLKEINDSVFSDCTNLEEIILPNSIKTIGASAFVNNESLTKITLPSSLETICQNAFANCKKLEEIILPNKVKMIESKAFSNNETLTKVKIPATLKEFFNDAFVNCKNLKTIDIDPENKLFDSSYDSILYEKETKTLVNSFKGNYIPEDTKVIAEIAFANRDDITEIIIPDTVKSINDYAFYNCSNLEKVILSSNLIKIGTSAFANCIKLKELIIPNKVVYIGSNSFKNCTSLKELTFEEPINKFSENILTYKIDTIKDDYLIIEESAFANCTSITKLKFPNKIMNINQNSFKNCTSLKELYIEEYTTYISNGAFTNCSNSLEKIEVNENNVFYNSYNNCNAIIDTHSKNLIIGCKNTIIPDDTITIGYASFADNTSLKEIKIPSGVKCIDTSAFENCTSLKEINIPNTVEEIKYNSFMGCKNIETINIEKGNINYRSSNYGNSIINIDTKTLIFGCKNTKIPDDILTIDGDAFYKNDSIKDIHIPKSIQNIRPNTFDCCDNLESITVDIDNPYYDSRENCNALVDKKQNAIIKGCKNTKIAEGITTILPHAFKNSKIKNISIPASIRSIGRGAFYNCKEIETIEVDKENKVYDSRNNCNAIISTKSNKLFLSCKNTILSDDIIITNKNNNLNNIDTMQYIYSHYLAYSTEIKKRSNISKYDLYAYIKYAYNLPKKPEYNKNYNYNYNYNNNYSYYKRQNNKFRDLYSKINKYDVNPFDRFGETFEFDDVDLPF